MANNEPRRKRRDGFGWYVTFVLIAVVAFFALSAVTGQEALAAALRVIWNGFALVANLIMRGLGSLLSLIARGVGWRRLTRIANVIGGIGLGYAASVVFDDEKVRKARGWRGQLRAAIGVAKAWWQNLRLIWKLVIVAVLGLKTALLVYADIVNPITLS